MRAVFYITLIHDRGTVALSNGMEIGQFYQKLFRFTHNDYVKYGNVNTWFNKSGVPYAVEKSRSVEKFQSKKKTKTLTVFYC